MEEMTIERIALTMGWTSQFEGDLYPGGDCWENYYDPNMCWIPCLPSTGEEILEYLDE